ncbi:MAG: hypothetical protein HAW59_05380 [Betaproteobacteria bacterium]|nr:hypothetical protein [Betaproteobacteria bacterium]
MEILGECGNIGQQTKEEEPMKNGKNLSLSIGKIIGATAMILVSLSVFPLASSAPLTEQNCYDDNMIAKMKNGKVVCSKRRFGDTSDPSHRRPLIMMA